MAKFILGNAHRQRAVDNVVVRNALWLADLVFVGAFLGLFRWLPVSWGSAFGARLGRIFGTIAKRRTLHVRANLSLVLPEAPPAKIDRLASDVWANAGALVAQYPKLQILCDPAQDRLDIEIDEQIPAYGTPGASAVFVSAHIGNWEVAAAAVTRLGIAGCAMYAPLSNPWLDRKMLKYRAALGCDLIARDAGLRGFIETLRAGKSPLIVTDRRIEGGKPIPFFGEDKESSILPARLAMRFGVPLVPVEVTRLPGLRFRVRFHAPLRPCDPEATSDEQVMDLAHQINATFERWITSRPGEWLCTSKIWPSSVLRTKTDVYEPARGAAE